MPESKTYQLLTETENQPKNELREVLIRYRQLT